jgi:hypothetical protein
LRLLRVEWGAALLTAEEASTRETVHQQGGALDLGGKTVQVDILVLAV